MHRRTTTTTVYFETHSTDKQEKCPMIALHKLTRQARMWLFHSILPPLNVTEDYVAVKHRLAVAPLSLASLEILCYRNLIA